MTLVVAQTDGVRIGIVADTRVSQNDTAFPLGEGVVKTCLLPQGVSLSFCNSFEAASQAVAEFVRKRGAGYSETVAHFRESSRRTGNDYIIGFARTAKLVTIRNGSATNGLEKIAWIGDGQARSRFLKYYRKELPAPWKDRATSATMFDGEPVESPVHDLASAMRMVIADEGIASVGGFMSAVSSKGAAFNFCAYCDFFYDANWLMIDGTPYARATGEQLGFSVATIRPTSPGTNLTGFHFLKPKLTFLFVPDESGVVMSKCVTIRDVDAGAISAYAKRLLNLDFDLHCFAVEPAN
ncbi:MAG: hypothetical protein HY834_17185 [Devosia nanyangense]|uniref:Uncharacterized protein n=1 Tax=Devosia nanyangense TaxID=1228055 RepID=A0A933L5J2_9HYPH|nr:hypothetical protein [Devosia nanyangense]